MKRSVVQCPCTCKAQKSKTTTGRTSKGATPSSGYTVETSYERKHNPELRRVSFRLVDANGMASEWMTFPWCSVDMSVAIQWGLDKGFEPILNGWLSGELPACLPVCGRVYSR